MSEAKAVTEGYPEKKCALKNLVKFPQKHVLIKLQAATLFKRGFGTVVFCRLCKTLMNTSFVEHL